MYSKSELQQAARGIAAEYGVDPNLFMGLINQESRWNPQARSHVGAYGLTQIMPDTARNPGFGLRGLSDAELQDPMSQMRFGARYLKMLLNRYEGDVDQALAAYNWGAGNVDKKGIGEHMPKETRDYLMRVKGFADDYAGMPRGDYEITPATGETGMDAIGMYAPLINDGNANSGADASAPGSTEGADRSGFGGMLGAALRGGMVAGPVGMAGGFIGSAISNMAAERAAARKEAGLAPQRGIGLADVFSGLTNAAISGNPTAAAGRVAADVASRNLAPQDTSGYNLGTAVTDMGRAVASGQPVSAGLGHIAAGVANEHMPGTPEDGFGLDDGLRAGLGGFMKGGPMGAIGAIGAGFLGNKLESWADRQKAKVQDVAAGVNNAGLDYQSQPGEAVAPSGNYELHSFSSGDTNEYGVAGNDRLSDSLSDTAEKGGFSY